MQRDSDRGRFPTSIVAIGVALVAVVVIVMAVFMVFASRNSYGYGGHYGMMGGFGGWGMVFMIPVGLIVLLIIGYVIWRGFGWGGGCCGGHYGHYGRYVSDTDRENAMEILHRRYARGEISKEQYEQMKKDIVT
jgi:putative membrane protein